MEILKSQRESAKKRWSEFSESDKPRILVGAATCGRAAGALDVMEEFKKELSAAGISDKVELVETGCLGLCYAEPLVEIRACGTPSVLYSNVSPKDVAKLVKEHVVGGNAVREKAEAVMSDAEYDGIVPFKKHPMVELQKRVVLRNCGVINPDDFWHYLARGGYEGLERAFSMSPEDVIEEMKKSGLRGRGGAGFPTGMKWSFARASKSDEKYIICNADEGDPGAFMDRSVLEGDPHAIVEGLMIAGYAIGAQHAYIYVRSEYPLAIERLKTAIKQAEEAGLLRKKLENAGLNSTAAFPSASSYDLFTASAIDSHTNAGISSPSASFRAVCPMSTAAFARLFTASVNGLRSQSLSLPPPSQTRFFSPLSSSRAARAACMFVAFESL